MTTETDTETDIKTAVTTETDTETDIKTAETTDTETIRMTPRIALSIERIAARASELGHAAIEAQCDRALAGLVVPSTVYEMIRGDMRYWPDRAIDRLLRDAGRSVDLARRAPGDPTPEDHREADARRAMDALATMDARTRAEAEEATPNLGRQAFLVVCKDRHVDLGLSIHLTRAGADAAIAAFQAHYGDDHAWVEKTYGAPKWVRYVRSMDQDDGPSAYVEVTEVMR